MATFNPNAVRPPPTQNNQQNMVTPFGQPGLPAPQPTQQNTAQAQRLHRYFLNLAEQTQSNRTLMGVARMQQEIYEERLEAQRGRFAQMMDEARSFFGNAIDQLTSSISSLVSSNSDLASRVTYLEGRVDGIGQVQPSPDGGGGGGSGPVTDPEGGEIVDEEPEDTVIDTSGDQKSDRPADRQTSSTAGQEVRKDNIYEERKAGNSSTRLVHGPTVQVAPPGTPTNKAPANSGTSSSSSPPNPIQQILSIPGKIIDGVLNLFGIGR